MAEAHRAAGNDPGNVVIGVGNPERGDDGVGCVVAGLLRAHVPVVEQPSDALALVAAMRLARRVWLVDAAQSGSAPGTIHRIDCATEAPLPGGGVSSHGFGIAEAVGLARVLGELPHCIVYAIEAAHFTAGAGLSPAVARAAATVAERIRAELATPPPPSARRRPHPAPATDRR